MSDTAIHFVRVDNSIAEVVTTSLLPQTVVSYIKSGNLPEDIWNNFFKGGVVDAKVYGEQGLVETIPVDSLMQLVGDV